MERLSDLLREGTAEAHSRAEQTGVVRDMLEDRVSREAYQLYLRNLHAVYTALEHDGLEGDTAAWSKQIMPADLHRAASIANDLEHLVGSGWGTELPLLTSAIDYRDRIAELAAQGNRAGLAAHAYVRYLGDLSGGQMLSRVLARQPGLSSEQLSFYRFDDIADAEAARHSYRLALDEFGRATATSREVVEEARRAFEHNIDLSCEVKQHVDAVAGSAG